MGVWVSRAATGGGYLGSGACYIGCSGGWSSFRSEWALGDAEMYGLVARGERGADRDSRAESEAAVGLARGLASGSGSGFEGLGLGLDLGLPGSGEFGDT